MQTNIAPKAPHFQEGQTACEKCGSPVWRARRPNGDHVQAETAPKVRSTVGKLLRERHVGHIALTFPLAGTGAAIVATVTRKLTAYRLHICRAFSSAQTRSDAKASTRPTLTYVGNMNDLLSKCGGGK